MTEKTYQYRDAMGHLYTGKSAVAPEGMRLVPDGVKAVIEDGQGVRTAIHMMDGVQREVAGLTPTFDTAGASHLLTDAAKSPTLDAALAVCPRGTEDIQHKVARHIIDARTALSDAGFQNAVHGLHGMSRQYLARAHLSIDTKAKEALTRASEAVAGFADSLAASKGQVAAGGGYAGHKSRMADAWKDA